MKEIITEIIKAIMEKPVAQFNETVLKYLKSFKSILIIGVLGLALSNIICGAVGGFIVYLVRG